MPTSRLAGHGAVYLLARAVQLAAYVVVTPVVTRQLDVPEFGTVALSLLVFQALAAIAPLGLTSVVAWSIFEREDDAELAAQRLLLATTGIALVIVAVAQVTAPVWSGMFADVDAGGPLQLATWLALPFTVQAGALTIFQAQGRPGAFVACTAVGSAGGQVLGLVLLAGTPTPTAYLTGVLIGSIAGAVLALALLPLRTLRPAGRPRILAGIVHGGPTVAHLVGFMVLALADRVLIERILGLESAAHYQVAYVVGSAGSVILYGLNNAWGPMVYADEDDGRWSTLVRTAVPLARLTALLVAGVALAAPIGLRILAPAAYGTDELADVAALVAAGTLFDFAYLAGVHVLFKRKRTAGLLVAMPAAAVLNVLLNLALLSPWGLRGAGVATLVGYVLLAALVGRASRRVGVVPWDLVPMASALALAVGAVAVALVLPSDGPFLALRIALTVGVAVPLVGPMARAWRRERAGVELASA